MKSYHLLKTPSRISKIFCLGLLKLFIYLLIGISCTSDNDSKESVTKTNLKEAASDSLSDNNNHEQSTQKENEFIMPPLTELEQAIIDADEEDFYLVYTDEGYDYVKGDLNNDGKEGDVAVLLTKEANPQNYTSETEVFLLLREDKAGNLQQLSYSGELGGESIQYKDAKKLTWNDGVLTYTHQSMRNHMEVDIKVVDIKTKIIDKISICYYSDSGCEDLYVASEQQDSLALSALSLEFLDSIAQ
jgi:hypothetical protein